MKRRSNEQRRVVIASSFHHALREIALYYRELRTTHPDAGARFARLRQLLTEDVLPRIAASPSIGRRYRLVRTGDAYESTWLDMVNVALARDPQAQVREWISGDFALLYVARSDDVVFVGIKHHRQAGY